MEGKRVSTDRKLLVRAVICQQPDLSWSCGSTAGTAKMFCTGIPAGSLNRRRSRIKFSRLDFPAGLVGVGLRLSGWLSGFCLRPLTGFCFAHGFILCMGWPWDLVSRQGKGAACMKVKTSARIKPLMIKILKLIPLWDNIQGVIFSENTPQN